MHGPLLHARLMACYSGPHEAWSRSLANDGRSLVPKASAPRPPEAGAPPVAVIVSSAAGGIQFEKQRRGVLVDLTSHHFDLEVFPPSVHTCRTVTRSEAH